MFCLTFQDYLINILIMKQKEVLHIKVDPTKLRNEMHFDVQLNTRANVFRDRTKYTRKKKHKGKEEE